MRRSLLLLVATALTVQPALALHPDSKGDLENLKTRIERLEEGAQDGPAEEPPLSLSGAGKHLSFGGLLELEASYTDEGGSDRSDLALATFEFSTEVTLNDQIGGHLLLLYEEDADDDNLKVDEAAIGLHCTRPFLGQTVAFYGGKLYLPFGTFNSFMVSDPLTLDLGETNDTAAVLALEGGPWELRLGVFSGGTDAAGDEDRIDSLVAALEMIPLETVRIGFSWISDLAESDAGLVADSSLYRDSVAGASAYLSAGLGALGLEAEVVGALEDFDAPLVGLSDLTGKRPLVWNLEVSYQPIDGLLLAVRYEQAEGFQDDVSRYGATSSYGLFRNTVVALEYLHADPENDPDSDTATAQLAFEF